MNSIPNIQGETLLPDAHNRGVESRIFRTMVFAVVVAGAGSLPFAPWRVTTGLLLGGVLSLLNHHWLSSSTAAAFTVA